MIIIDRGRHGTMVRHQFELYFMGGGFKTLVNS